MTRQPSGHLKSTRSREACSRRGGPPGASSSDAGTHVSHRAQTRTPFCGVPGSALEVCPSPPRGSCGARARGNRSAGGAARSTRANATRGRVRDEPTAPSVPSGGATAYHQARLQVVRGQHARGVPRQLAVDDVRERVERAFRVLDPSARRHDDERAGRAIIKDARGPRNVARGASSADEISGGVGGARLASVLRPRGTGSSNGAQDLGGRAARHAGGARARAVDARGRRGRSTMEVAWCVPKEAPSLELATRVRARDSPRGACFGAPRASASRHLPPSPPRLTRRPSHASPRLHPPSRSRSRGPTGSRAPFPTAL